MAHPVLGDGPVRLRPATRSDFAFLRSFFDQPAVYEHWGGAPLADAEIREKYLGERSPRVECFVVEVNEQPIGLAQYHSNDHERSGGMDMALLPEHRGQGVGTAVVRLVAAYVRTELGWQRCTVDPDASNTRGVHFWERVGFQPVQRIEGDRGREPYWLMEWTVADAP
jgi:aminoglycoside 6'-N-acetyltransferase